MGTNGVLPLTDSTVCPNLGKEPGSRRETDDGNQRLFRCGDCDKTYTRSDHLARHVRQHTKERPYSCPACAKTFARADLLRRHATVHRDGKKVLPLVHSTHQSRVIKACRACVNVHVKCNNEKPCSRCQSRAIDCQDEVDNLLQPCSDVPSLPNTPKASANVVDLARRVSSRTHDAGSRASEQYPANTANTANLKEKPSQLDDVSSAWRDHAVEEQSEALSAGPLAESCVDEMIIDGSHPMDWLESNPTQTCLDNSNELRDFLAQVMTDDNAVPNDRRDPFSGSRTPWNFFDMSANTALELDDIDLNHLQDYSHNNPFVADIAGQSLGERQSLAMSSSSGVSPGTISSQLDSTWCYRPVPKDNAANNLSMPADIIKSGLSGSQIMTAESLGNGTRDQILAMMVAVSLDSKFIISFPSVGLLDGLLQYFFCHSPLAPIFHPASFRPSQAVPVLVAIMVAGGAVIAPDVTLRKFGFALQEATRVTLADLLEKDNSLTRDLSIWQTYAVMLDIGLWSGDSRKMEIAEGFLNPVVTMLRRSGCFTKGNDANILDNMVDDTALERTWHRWIVKESIRRLVYYLFSHDAHASISLFTNPCISYAELALPLPCIGHLWRAGNAQKWRTVFLAHQHKSMAPLGSTPSVIDLLQDMNMLSSEATGYDYDMATQALICAIWGMIRDYRQHHAILDRAHTPWTNGSLLLTSRLTELERLVQHVKMSIDGTRKSVSDYLNVEIVSMHLQMSLEQFHRFAGIEGPEEAKRTYPDLREWVQTTSARQAICHAGAILRYANQAEDIRAFAAVAVYQAALAMWSYGVVRNGAVPTSDIGKGSGNSSSPNPADVIILNGEDADARKRFAALNRGDPAIQVASSRIEQAGVPVKLIPLSRPAEVMEAIMDTLSAKYSFSTSARPPLVDNLLGLLGSLRAAAIAA